MTKKKISTDDVIKNIFEPVSSGGTALLDKTSPQDTLVEAPAVPQADFHAVSQSQRPSLTLSESQNRRLFLWGMLGVALLGLSHVALSYLEEDALFLQTQQLYQAKQSQAAAIGQKLAEHRKRERRWKTLIEKGKEEQKSRAMGLQFLERGHRKGANRGGLIRKLSELSSEGIWFQKLSMMDQGVLIRGVGLNEPFVRGFVQALNRSPEFERAELLFLNVVSGKNGDFFTYEIYANISL